MIGLSFQLSAFIVGFMYEYMPTNRAIRWLRTPERIKWAIPVCLVATPAYWCAMGVCVLIIEAGGPEYLHLLVVLFGWNTLKFAVFGLMAPFLWAGHAIRKLIARRRFRRRRASPFVGAAA